MSRMDEHPLIRFADGPAGRRARLVGTGKDVWEIIAVVRDNDGRAAEAGPGERDRDKGGSGDRDRGRPGSRRGGALPPPRDAHQGRRPALRYR
jgi:hypothetical protein